MKFKFKQKLKASSLVETLVASVIATICFAVGLMIYTNVLKSGFGRKQVEIKLFIEKDLKQSLEGNIFKSEKIFFDNTTIEKSVSFYNGTDDILHITYLAKNPKGKAIFEKKSLKYIGK